MKYKVLIVDDQPESIKYTSILLKKMEFESEIYSAPNGKVALTLIEKIMPDIILSDWGMPEMDGLQLLKTLKKCPDTKDIPFIMISAVNVDAPSMKESFDAGVHDYLRKPFDKLEFMARVSATLKLHEAYLMIKKSNQEIADQALLIAEQHKELQSLNTLKDKIFSIISHDIRAPLATLDGLLQIFEDKEIELSERELREYATGVKLELNGVQSLMDNLLFWAKAQIRNTREDKVSLNLYDIVQEIYSLYKQKMLKKNLEFYNHMEDIDNKIYVDKNMISFVIRNLFANAIKFTPEGGRITLHSEMTQDSIQISVIDNGVGMNADAINVLFSADTLYTQEGTSGELGTGIGLMLCKELVEQNNGILSVQSELGKGSKFSVTIPV